MLASSMPAWKRTSTEMPEKSTPSIRFAGKTRAVSRPSGDCPTGPIGVFPVRASASSDSATRRNWRTTLQGPVAHSSPSIGVPIGMPLASQAARTLRSAIRR